MTAPVWVTPTGFLGTLTERAFTSTYVLATGENVAYSTISGSLPIGLRLNSTTGLIAGVPSSVPQTQKFSFAVRAASGSDVSDRTFNFDVGGATEPFWITPSGALPVGLNGEYYSINKEPVNYTVRAETDILSTGNKLKYFIADTDGQLPPGLTLSIDGRITGYIDDLLKLDALASVTGGYDEDGYDGYPYDHSPFVLSFLDTARQTTINKIYQFYITVTDGIINSKRLFTITVLDPDSLRSDTTYVRADMSDVDAGSSQLLAPLWQDKNGNLLPSVYNLGMIRASKNQIITLYEYDPYALQGPTTYDWNNVVVNPDIKFITDSRIDLVGLPETNLAGQQALYFKDTKMFPVAGMKIRFSDTFDKVDGNPFDNTVYIVTGVISLGNGSGIMELNQPLAKDIPDSRIAYVGTSSQHPPGMNLDTATGELYGHPPYQPAYSTSYRFTVQLKKKETATGDITIVNQIFILTVKGNVNSAITFTSPSKIGSIFPGQVSELAVTAINTNTNNSVKFEIVQGALPEGLSLNADGTIQGITSFRSQHVIYDSTSTEYLLTLDSDATTIDKNYYFTVRASDVYKLSAIEKEFYITIIPDLKLDFARMYVKPFLKVSRDIKIDPVDKRAIYRSFISDATIFDPAVIYRPNDPEFGVQKQIKMLIETGIQAVDFNIYATAMSQYFARKRFYFGSVKSILAQDSAGKNVYELVYVDMVDDQMIGNITPSYAVSVGNMQIQLETIDLDPSATIIVNEHLRPRYMTTLQPSTGVPIGFIKAVPICYTIPGGASKVLSRIQNSGFDFKQFDFDTDRIIIETVQNDSQTSWLAYPTNVQ